MLNPPHLKLVNVSLTPRNSNITRIEVKKHKKNLAFVELFLNGHRENDAARKLCENSAAVQKDWQRENESNFLGETPRIL